MRHDASGYDYDHLQPCDDNHDDVCVSGSGRTLCAYQHQHNVRDADVGLYGTFQYQHHLCDAGTGLSGA